MLNIPTVNNSGMNFARRSRYAWTTLVSLFVLIATQSVFAQPFKAALIANGNITLGGNVTIDSFDSLNPTNSTNGKYDPTKRKDGGNVASVGHGGAATNLNGPTISIGGSVDIYGRVYYYPGDTVLVNGGGTAGSLDWVNSTNFGIETGWSIATNLNLSITDAPSPPTINAPLPSKQTNYFQGTNIANSYLLTSGSYARSNVFGIASNEKILIQGDVKLYLATNFAMAGQSQIIIGTNSSLTIYGGASLGVSGLGIANPGYATNCVIYGMERCRSVAISLSGSSLSFLVYAPYADMTVSSSGSSTLNISGSLLATSILVQGKVSIHCDEAFAPLVGPPLHIIYPATLYPFKPPWTVGTIWIYVQGPYGYPHAVESSTNLVDWTRETTNISPFSFFFTNSDARQFFFRSVLLE